MFVRLLDFTLSILFAFISLTWLALHSFLVSHVPAPACRWFQKSRRIQAPKTTLPRASGVDQFASESAIPAYEALLDAACDSSRASRQSSGLPSRQS